MIQFIFVELTIKIVDSMSGAIHLIRGGFKIESLQHVLHHKKRMANIYNVTFNVKVNK